MPARWLIVAAWLVLNGCDCGGGAVASPTPAAPLAVGNGPVCVRASGHVECWGMYGAAIAADVAEVLGSCARMVDGTVRCRRPLGAIEPVGGIADAVALGSEEPFPCAIRADGRVTCWTTYGAAPMQAFDVPGIDQAEKMVPGEGPARCAVRRGGGVLCWQPNQPASPLAGAEDAVAITFDGAVSCLAARDGTVRCRGPLAPPDAGAAPPPSETTIAALAGARDLTLDPQWLCAWIGTEVKCVLRRRPDGSVRTVDGVADAVGLRPEGVVVLRDGRALKMTYGPADDHDQARARLLDIPRPGVCVLAAAGMWCPGPPAGERTPLAIPGTEGVGHLVASGGRVCGLAGESILCWGWDPPQVPTLEGIVAHAEEESHVVALAMGGRFSCAIRDGGRVWCRGDGRFGQLGDGEIDPAAPEPELDPAAPRRSRGTVRPAMEGAVQIAAGGAHACGLGAGGTVRCWGWNASGQLGDGTQVDAPAPVQVRGLDDAVEIAAGQMHSCARRGDGSVWCWGDGGRGQLGGGGTAASTTPREVTELGTVVQIAAGAVQTCARAAGGAVQCVGPAGANLTELRTAELIACGGRRCCGLRGGTVHCVEWF